MICKSLSLPQLRSYLRRQPVITALGVSLLIHIGLGGLHLTSSIFTSTEPLKPLDAPPIEITVINDNTDPHRADGERAHNLAPVSSPSQEQNVNTVATTSSQKTKNPSQTQAKKPKGSPLFQAGPTYVDVVENKLSDPSGSVFEGHEDAPITTAATYDNYSPTGAFGYVNQGGIVKSFENNSFYKSLWSRVRFHSGFPDDFVKYRLNGKARIHVLVNRKGQIIGDFLKAHSSDPFLELYSMAILAKALQEPLPSQQWAEDKQIPVVFEFEYAFVSDLITWESLKTDKGTYQENKFVIRNYRYSPSDLEQIMADLYRDYYPPVLIFPGGAFVDIIALYEKYDRYFRKKDFRSSAQQREDLFKSFNLRELLQVAINNPNLDLVDTLNKGSLMGSPKTFSDPTMSQKFMIPSTDNSQDIKK
ncbi:MAG: hypothetical protein M9899_10955 [Bdellovibrionaceae bacterium]|nr:hypothetical protein [Pseudobdellovibrionaceae bacterium]